MLPDGSTRFDGKLLRITGKTVIDEAVIDGASIKSLSASKLSSGEADFKNIKVINFDAKNVTSGTFKGLVFEGGIIRGNNGNTEINLNSNVTTYNGTAKIEFRSPYNSLEFNSGGRKAFLCPTISNGTNYAAFALGVNDRGEGNPNKDFVGIKIFNQYNSRQIELIGDVTFTGYYQNGVSSKSLSQILDLFRLIDENFNKLVDFRKKYGEGAPGLYPIRI